MSEDCEHNFQFLRQETELEGGYRPDRKTFDVFYCPKCLAYKRKHVLTEEESRERFGWDVKWRSAA